MPYPNEHACRLEDPGKYDSFSRKNCEQKHEGKCIDVIYGIKNNKSEIQALRYDKNIWSESSARSHCKDRGGTFEAASGSQDSISWFRIKAESETDVGEIWIYDEIGGWFGITAKQFIDELKEIKSTKIDLHINSPGGDVFEGAAVYNAIKNHKASVTTYIDGLAASIASVIALAGTKVVMAQNALFMMHNPWGFVIGQASDMRKQADVLDKVRDTMVGTYQIKSGKSSDEVKELLEAETWFNANEAEEEGFIDEISGKMDLAACAKFGPVMAKMGFRKIPKAFNPNDLPSAKDAEKALRDAGFSIKEAKTILSKGFTDGLRDVDDQDDLDQRLDSPRDVEKKKPITNDRTQDLLLKADLVQE